MECTNGMVEDDAFIFEFREISSVIILCGRHVGDFVYPAGNNGRKKPRSLETGYPFWKCGSILLRDAHISDSYFRLGDSSFVWAFMAYDDFLRAYKRWLRAVERKVWFQHWLRLRGLDSGYLIPLSAVCVLEEFQKS